MAPVPSSSSEVPVCGCGKPWPPAALRYGAQCISCGQNSPSPPLAPPRPDPVAVAKAAVVTDRGRDLTAYEESMIEFAVAKAFDAAGVSR